MKTFKRWETIPENFTGWGRLERQYINKIKYVRFYFGKPNTFHRLDGPAAITEFGEEEFYIDDILYSKIDYWKHPSVIKETIKSIIEL